MSEYVFASSKSCNCCETKKKWISEISHLLSSGRVAYMFSQKYSIFNILGFIEKIFCKHKFHQKKRKKKRKKEKKLEMWW